MSSRFNKWDKIKLEKKLQREMKKKTVDEAVEEVRLSTINSYKIQREELRLQRILDYMFNRMVTTTTTTMI